MANVIIVVHVRVAITYDRYGNALQYVYDLIGNSTQPIDRASTTTTTPDALNRIIDVTPPGGNHAHRLHPGWWLRTVATPKGFVSSTTYDDAARIVSLVQQNAATVAGEIVDE